MEQVFVSCDSAELQEKLRVFLPEHGFGYRGERDGCTVALYVPHCGRRGWAEDIRREALLYGVGIVVLVREEDLPLAERKLEGSGAIVISFGLSASVICAVLRAAGKTVARIRALQAEVEKLRARVDDERVIGRAKCALVRERGMREPDAHRYIEKSAMDYRLPRREIAQSILEDYEG